MLPRNAEFISEKDGVTFHRSSDGSYYATAFNPDLGEEDVVGYIMDRGASTELQVVSEMQKQGIGGELQYLFRTEFPDAQSGGLTEAGEGLLKKTFGRMRDENSSTFALGGLATARKGITTEEGLDMADKKFQRNDSEADTNNDGELSTREKEIADAKQKNELPEMAHGGMACSCGSGGDCGCGTGMMSEPLPIGTTEAEVADDISVMISEGEYVLPANVVKWHGLKHIMSMQDEAEMGLMMMHSEGLIQEVNNETGEESDSEGVEDAEVSDEGDSEQEEAEEVIETPEGNEIEVAGIDTVITEPEFDETEDYENSDYGKPTSLGTMKRAKYSIIV